MLAVRHIDDRLWDDLAEILAQHDPKDLDYPQRVDLGGPRRTDSRLVLEAILYREETGCAWMRLPTFYPHYSVVYRRWRWWEETGVLERLYQVILARMPEVH